MQRTLAGLPSSFAAQAFKCGSALARNGFTRRRPFGRKLRIAAEQRHQPMRQRDAGARRPHDFKFGRGRFAARDGFHGAGGAQRISAHDLIHAFGHQRIAERRQPNRPVQFNSASKARLRILPGRHPAA